MNPDALKNKTTKELKRLLRRIDRLIDLAQHAPLATRLELAVDAIVVLREIKRRTQDKNIQHI